MKTRLALLAIGIAVGVLIQRMWNSTTPNAPTQQVAVENEAEPSLTESIRQAKPLEPSVSLKRETKRDTNSETAPPAKAPLQALTKPATEEETLSLNLSEETVSEIERQRDLLKSYAYSIQTSEGWKIQILPEDQIFMKAGLKSGDLITYESMDRQLQSPERAQLARRMVAILNEIQR